MERFVSSSVKSRAAYNVDVGFRAYMVEIYKLMSFGLGITACVALALAYMPPSAMPLVSTLRTLGMFASLGVVFYLSFALPRLSIQRAATLFWIYSVLMGMSVCWVFQRYSSASIASAFFSTAALFGGASLYGLATKRDLTSVGSWLSMGLWGLLAAMIVNMFMGSSVFGYFISVISVVLFTGLLAWRTQNMRELYYTFSSQKDVQQKLAILAALDFYTTAVNIFLHMLRLTGRERS